MAPSRRELLTGAVATLGLAVAGCGRSGSGRAARQTGPVPRDSVKPVRHDYGADPSQFGELSVPAGKGRPGTVVIMHGGFWLAEYDLSLGRPLAADLVRRGYPVWNLEYRRLGNGGGWPATFDDVAAGIAKLADLDVPTDHVVGIGHSAGGQLATWAAGLYRHRRPKVQLTAVVSQAGVLALTKAEHENVGSGTVDQLMGGTPEQVSERYRAGDPVEAVPLDLPVLCVHSRADRNVPFSQSVTYVDAAKKAGGDATLHEASGDHFTLIDPTSKDWQIVVDALPRLLTA